MASNRTNSDSSPHPSFKAKPTETNATPQKARIASIEIFRIVAVIAVVIIHTRPFGFASAPDIKHTLATVIDLSCRFAVPFFFIVSGYFLGENSRAGQPTMSVFWRSAKRLLSVYAAWCLFYLLVPVRYLYVPDSGNWPTMVLNNLRRLVEYYGLDLPLTGARELLWFLPALVMGLGIVAVCVTHGWRQYLLYGAAALYGIGLLGGSYSLLWTGNDAMDFVISTRNGPFFSTLCVAIGWMISNRQAQGKWQVSTPQAVAMIVGGLLLQVFEAQGLSAAANVPFRSFDYVIGTVVMGAGVFYWRSLNRTGANVGLFCIGVATPWASILFIPSSLISSTLYHGVITVPFGKWAYQPSST
ncbi:MAG: acyltransferase [Phormidesmis sp. RL_2_1]|nr:acyltransferase [Phormidesmis sp. RL_2_1]